VSTVVGVRRPIDSGGRMPSFTKNCFSRRAISDSGIVAETILMK
jgi:hypothetical protein